MNILCTLDRLILYVETVKLDEFDVFFQRLEALEWEGKVTKILRWIGTGVSDYHYNVKFGEGDGAIHIGYKHNSKTRSPFDSYDLRMECNPSKVPEHCAFVDVFRQTFQYHTTTVKGADYAFDIPRSMSELMAVSLTGRQRSMFQDTFYFGASGKTGRVKMYNKKRELSQKQGVHIEGELTRFEYSLRLEQPVLATWFGIAALRLIDEEYRVSVINLDDTDALVKAAILTVKSGDMQIREFTKTYRKKIKDALETMTTINFSEAYSQGQDEIIRHIQRLTPAPLMIP